MISGQTVPLGAVACINPPASTVALQSDELVDFVPMADVEADQSVSAAHESRPYGDVKKGYTSFVDGDILLAKITPCFENGKISQIRVNSEVGFGSTEFHVVRPRVDMLDGRYLVHLLRQEKIRSEGERRMTGSAGQRRVPRNFLESLPIFLPSISEQRRIAAILDKAEELRAKRSEALAQLDRLAQSIFVEMFGDPVLNPKKFPRLKLGELIKFEGGSQPPASTFSDQEGEGMIRLVQIRDFKSDKFKTFIPRALAKRFFSQNDVMIGRYGPPVFQILRGLSGSYNVALMKAVPKEGATKEFIFHLLQERNLHQYVVSNSERTAGQSGVNLDLLEAYDAYLPPIELQHEFEKRMNAISKLKKMKNKSLEASSALFKSIEQRSFSGYL